MSLASQYAQLCSVDYGVAMGKMHLTFGQWQTSGSLKQLSLSLICVIRLSLCYCNVGKPQIVKKKKSYAVPSVKQVDPAVL